MMDIRSDKSERIGLTEKELAYIKSVGKSGVGNATNIDFIPYSNMANMAQYLSHIGTIGT